jgi:hypothetical protein
MVRKHAQFFLKKKEVTDNKNNMYIKEPAKDINVIDIFL